MNKTDRIAVLSVVYPDLTIEQLEVLDERAQSLADHERRLYEQRSIRESLELESSPCYLDREA